MGFVAITDAGQGRLATVAPCLPGVGFDLGLDVGLSVCPGWYSITYSRNPLGGAVLALPVRQPHRRSLIPNVA